MNPTHPYSLSATMVNNMPSGLGKTCMTNKMYSCASGEMCFGHDGTSHGHCVCFIGYARHNNSGPCKPIAPTAIPVLIHGKSW